MSNALRFRWFYDFETQIYRRFGDRFSENNEGKFLSAIENGQVDVVDGILKSKQIDANQLVRGASPLARDSKRETTNRLVRNR
jgi:hypothetical protein